MSWLFGRLCLLVNTTQLSRLKAKLEEALRQSCGLIRG
jgi:hypothetical protein